MVSILFQDRIADLQAIFKVKAKYWCLPSQHETGVQGRHHGRGGLGLGDVK